jgi:hypothetical protein
MSDSKKKENLFDLENFVIEDKSDVFLGSGSFAKVYKAKNIIDAKYYAIKIVG